MEGLLDWYLLGVVVGLAVAAGVALRRSALSAVGAGAALGVAVVIVALALPWWAFAVLAAGLIGWFAFRHLTLAAVPAAYLGAIVLALLPALGYMLPVLAPLAGARLGRRAESRYAGLRILARD